MANIAFVTTSTTSIGDLSKVTQAFIDKGHTVTRFSSETVTLNDLLPFKLIACCRPPSGTPSYNNVIKSALDSGIPVMCGPSSGSSTNVTVPVACGIVSGVTGDDIQPQIYPIADHIVFTQAGVPLNTPMDVFSGSASYIARAALSVSTSPGSSTLAQMTASNTDRSLVIAPQGSTNLFGGVFGAPFAFVGYFWPPNDVGSNLSAMAKSLMLTIAEYLIANTTKYRISGTVKDATGSPLSRQVKVLGRPDLGVVAQATSDPVTGKYSMDVPTQTPYIVVCLDVADGTKQSLIRDHVFPVVVT